MTLIERIYSEVRLTPWFTLHQIAFAIGTSASSVSGTCSSHGTTFKDIRTAEIKRLKEMEVIYNMENAA